MNCGMTTAVVNLFYFGFKETVFSHILKKMLTQPKRQNCNLQKQAVFWKRGLEQCFLPRRIKMEKSFLEKRKLVRLRLFTGFCSSQFN